MKRVLLSVLLLCFCLNIPAYSYQDDVLQNIFITDIPDPPETPQTEEEVAALKGYAEFMEGAEVLYLSDENEIYSLNLKQPQKIGSKQLVDSEVLPAKHLRLPYLYSKYSGDEYRISDYTGRKTESFGNVSFGTTYGAAISTTQLERETGFFTKYQYKNFAVSTSYKKTLGTTGGIYYDNIYFSPEYKINDIFTVKDVFSVDPIRHRRKNQVVLTINPFGNTEKDRLNFEMSAGQTYDSENYLIRSQVEFSTRFKL